MNLQMLPHVIGVLLALLAFGVAGVAGILSDVPPDVVALRAVIAAAIFWGLGIIAGRVLLDSVCEAMSEQVYEQPDETSGTRR